MVVYKITNLVNGKLYIGQTVNKNPEYRFSGHKADAKYRPTLPIHKALCKYGADNFSFEVIRKCGSIPDLNFWERYYIHCFDSIVPNGYNVDSGGCRDDTLLSYAKGRVFTEEHRKKISDMAKLRTHDATTRKKLSASRRRSNHKSHNKIVVKLDSNGNTLEIFQSIYDASKAWSIGRDTISFICRGIKPQPDPSYQIVFGTKTQAGSTKN